jgi:hypothetical protein
MKMHIRIEKAELLIYARTFEQAIEDLNSQSEVSYVDFLNVPHSCSMVGLCVDEDN